MRQYELTYLISDNVPESELNKVTGKVGGYVRDGGGKLLKEEIWGRRKLAYPIQKQDFATYVTINFNLPADKAFDFEHNIKMTGKIVRHLMIVKDFGEEELTLTSEDIAGTEEIEEVVGGEKSFEAVEGETEESKDLMAVRGEEEEEKEEAEEVKEEEKAEEVAAEPEEKTEEVKENKEEVKEKKPAKKGKKKEAGEESDKEEIKAKGENEADRLSKLDKELDDILGEEL